ncbi:MAG: hypothetical protein EOM26_01075 [Alphaproteobacteria bacterium]|nr:hypothetical protein [Alphaproteobacteria bacterium]
MHFVVNGGQMEADQIGEILDGGFPLALRVHYINAGEGGIETETTRLVGVTPDNVDSVRIAEFSQGACRVETLRVNPEGKVLERVLRPAQKAPEGAAGYAAPALAPAV